ncbi:TonB-dependent siderophore receptor [Paraburkholderia sp.]|uniref:TonB-dependent siderophore receptor n=1 Tax=Paraburkholderia sp. TaxID=1926495 RepID=UPI003D6E192F
MLQPRRNKTGWAAYVLSALIGTASVGAYAQLAVIDLPAQRLSRALSTLAREGEVNILAPDALVVNRSAPAVSGRLTVREALNQLLRGTGLDVEQRDEKTYVIRTPVLPAAKPKLKAETDTDTVMPTIMVTDSATSANAGFVTDSTSTATRTDTPISQTPQSIQVVTQNLIESEQLQSVTEALNNVAGVTVQASGNGAPTVYIRGFSAPTMSNGTNNTGFSQSLGIPMAGVDRVEVLMGADSILSGVMAPGGVVNVVTKQPQAASVHALTVQTGSYGDWLGAIDLAGALTKDERLTYRFVLSTERQGESFGGYDGGKTFYVAPSLGWKSGGTNLVVGYQHDVQDVPLVQTTLLGPNGPLPLQTRATPLGNMLNQSDTMYADLKQRLGTIGLFESKTQYQASRYQANNFYFALAGTPDSTFYAGVDSIQHSYGLDSDNHLRAKFAIGSVKQTVLAGFDYNVYWTDSQSTSGVFVAPFPSPALPPIAGRSVATDGGKGYFSNVYFQDQLTWGRLHVLASIAHGTSWGSTTLSQSAWTPNIGVLYQLTDSVAVYANALRSFQPPQQGILLLGGGQTPPTSGRSMEVGFKLNFFDDRLNVTTDVFRSAITNALISVPGTNYYTLGGGQVVRGAELNVKGSPFPGLNLSAGYTYSNEQMRSSSSEVPPHSGSLWMTYDLQDERWRGWGAGIGVEARSGYQLARLHYKVPGQMQTDLSVYYRTKQWSMTLGIKNLFDRLLYQSSAGNTVSLQPGRLMYLTGRCNF